MQTEHQLPAEQAHRTPAFVTAGIAPALPPEASAVPRARRLPIPSWLGLLLSNRKALVGVVMLMAFLALAIFGPLIWQGDPTAADYTATPQQPPTMSHWLGTDQQEHDVFLQMVDGTRSTLVTVFAIGICTTVLGVIVGLIAGSAGGIVDEFLMLLANIVLVFPAFPLMVVVSSWIQVRNDLPIVAVVTLTSWAWGARVMRSQAMSIRQRDFVLAAIVSGESWLRIVFTEVMPNMISLIVSALIGTIVFGMLAGAGLYFLGFGNLSSVSWFSILYWAQNASALQTGAWWCFVPPGLAIALLGTSLSLINNGIDEISNPRLRVVKDRRRRPAVALPLAEAEAGS